MILLFSHNIHVYTDTLRIIRNKNDVISVHKTKHRIHAAAFE